MPKIDFDQYTMDELKGLRLEITEEIYQRAGLDPHRATLMLARMQMVDPERVKQFFNEEQNLYEREMWGNGWIQKDPRNKTMADGTVKTYRYWVYHYVEDGQHKTEYIGSDAKLEQWKAKHPE